MNHAAMMGISHRLAHVDELSQQRHYSIGGVYVVTFTAKRRQVVRQRLARHTFHREINSTIVQTTDIVNRHNAGMLQLAGDLCLFDKPHLCVIVAKPVVQNLQRQFSTQTSIGHSIHHAHTAAPQHAANFVAIGHPSGRVVRQNKFAGGPHLRRILSGGGMDRPCTICGIAMVGDAEISIGAVTCDVVVAK